MMDFARARRTMVDTQIRVNDVTDSRIIDALMDVPRENFVPDSRRALAYLDDDLPVNESGEGPARHLIEPMVLAKMLHAAAIRPDETVLDVGVATGYSAAILAHLAAHVVALEEDTALAATARSLLAPQANVAVVEGPLVDGASQRGPFDVIVLEGAVEVVPANLLKQLRQGGRLVAVVGRGRAAKCMVHTLRDDEVSMRPVFDAAIPALPGFEAPKAFVF
ncbi:protein-L-isoaspartate O-methyltransferase family protein [Phreatobacter sp. HK31-P]